MTDRSLNGARTGWSRAALFLLIGVCLLPGCFTKAKKQQLGAQRDYVFVQGRIEWDPPVTGPMLLLATAPDDPERIHGYRVIEEPRDFRMTLRRGESYSLWAVEDADGDLRIHPEERGSEPILLHLTEGVHDLVVRVEANSSAPLAQVFDVQEKLVVQMLGLEKTYANTGVVIELADERFSKEWSGKGTTAPVTFLTEIGAGTYMLQEYDPNRTPVLFIHGAEGSPRDFSYLIENLDDHLQPWVFHYPSGFGLGNISSHLAENVEELHVRHGFKEMYVVAHSMGGLMTRSFVQKNAAFGSRYITKLLTISTPWHGHSAAKMGVKMAPDSVPSWHDMVPGSEFQVETLETPLPEGLEYRLFFSYKGHSMVTAGADDESVSLESQLVQSVQDEATQVRGFNESHMSILKNDEVVARVNEFLQ